MALIRFISIVVLLAAVNPFVPCVSALAAPVAAAKPGTLTQATKPTATAAREEQESDEDGQTLQTENSGSQPGEQPAPTRNSAPPRFRHSIGIELANPEFGVLGTTAINYGYMTPKTGVEFYLGYSKTADTVNHSETTSNNEVSTPKTRTVAIADTGKVNPRQITFGVQPKYVVFADRWLRATAGFMFAYTSTGSVSYKTGSTTTSWNDTAQETTYSVQRNDVGNVSSSTTGRLLLGPRVGTDFYLRWFPHLSLGFSTGLLFGSGGQTTTKTDTEDKSFSVTNGAEQVPTVHTKNSAKSTQTPGTTGETVAIGGSTFNLMGSFTLRYVW